MDNNVAAAAAPAVDEPHTESQHPEATAEAHYNEVVAKLRALAPGIAAKLEQVRKAMQELETLQQQLGELQRGFTGGLYRTAQDEQMDELEVQIQDMANRLEAEQMEFEDMEVEHTALLRLLPDGPLPELE
ncbi:uncharacterized protein N7498_010355 [Penicillium cinerascens]|uniref:Uncharacterized protein n=1 Tax=Penicillium cinerascens TaxID=70096 RepID=A0A9W9JAK0_9EURO|nr:uncharacterized protein N7498_010355 [Penicillium cinerascens]KAJ5191370.1 hypothetical protein N7498_010355 [Penicillium cinerascens]